MMNLPRMNTYADLVVQVGVNLREEQSLLITTGPGTYYFAKSLAESAYRNGARFVRIVLSDPNLTKYRIEHSREDALSWIPNFVTSESLEYLADDWARVRIDSTEEMNALKGLDAGLVAKTQVALRSALSTQQASLMRNQHAWCVVAAPGEEWARYVAAHAQDTEPGHFGASELWNVLVPILRLDHDDPVRAWRDHMARLENRCAILNSLKIDEVEFQDAAADIVFGLMPTSLWKGGGATLPDGRSFLPNIPTEEVFTSPDYRRTSGKVACTRPVNVMENLVENAWFEFESGKVTKCGARTGAEFLEKYLQIDEGAPFVGELALVETESPLFKSGKLFGSILYDENASSHIALGAAYPSCLSNAAELNTPAKLKAAGCNISKVHTDFMIGSKDSRVRVRSVGGTWKTIMDGGVFCL